MLCVLDAERLQEERLRIGALIAGAYPVLCVVDVDRLQEDRLRIGASPRRSVSGVVRR